MKWIDDLEKRIAAFYQQGYSGAGIVREKIPAVLSISYG